MHPLPPSNRRPSSSPRASDCDSGDTETTPLLSGQQPSSSGLIQWRRGGGGGGLHVNDGSDDDQTNNNNNTKPTTSSPTDTNNNNNNNTANLVLFRRAIGINSSILSNDTANADAQPASLEEGRRTAVGIYRAIITAQTRKRRLHHLVAGLVWTCHGLQIVLGAVLTCLGAVGRSSTTTITVLGAVNTAVAGVLTGIKGKGLPEKLGRTESDFRQLQGWVEELDALCAMGVVGRDRSEVAALVERVFGRYRECTRRGFEVEQSLDRGVDSMGARSAGSKGSAGVRRPYNESVTLNSDRGF